jgi:hypothetical protein
MDNSGAMPAPQRVDQLRSEAHVVSQPPVAQHQSADVDCGGADLQQPLVARDEVVRLLLGDERRVTPIERVLADLIADELPLLVSLTRTKSHLAKQLLPSLEQPRRTLELAKLLKEVVGVSNTLSRRVENVLGTLNTIRVQQRLLGQQRGRDGI